MSGISLGQDEPKPLPQTSNADGSGSRPSPTPAQPTFVTSTHPDNPTFREADPASTGGVEEIVYQMTDSIAHGRIKAMGQIFHQTCPGDWDRRRMVGFGGTLRAYYEYDEYKE
ncbi:hypothetical protein PENPOL_c033G05072 [Penicillium polonicum]|uniref:Uncharacterized protein n=1 Tax=Penicillium polonicum TaxID=60169 RepID=A0A1V6N6A4_PENPO|nr:hypothetical protein PENPOL_c033G05072 [Penicillium polonicum]